MAIAAFRGFQKVGALKHRFTAILNVPFRSSLQVKHNIKIMSTKKNNQIVQPYLFFNGRCEEALDFYRKAIGAEVTALVRFKDSPDPTMCAPGTGEKIMHASLQIGDSTVFASDGECGGNPNFQGISLSLTASDETDAERLFAALAEGGKVTLPLTKTFFSPRFGMIADRFRVSWMVQAPPQKQK